MGIINVYKGINYDREIIKANGKLKDILPNYDFSKTLVLKEGNKLTPEYEVQENDVLFLRTVPAGITTTAIATIAVTAAVVVAGAVVGGVLYKQNKTLQEQLEKQQGSTNDIKKSPFLKGAKNQSAIGKTIPYIMGEMYHTPYMLNNGFYSVSGTNGETQMWNAELISGYNDQRLKSLSIGSTKVAEYNPQDVSQDGIKSINAGIYQTSDNKCKVEVCTNGELVLDGLNQKVVAQVYNEEVKHDHDADAEPVIEQLAENAQRVEVCIRFDGLRKYDNNLSTYVPHSVEVVPYWSNNPDAENPTWHEFTFDVQNDGSSSYTWITLTEAEVQTAIANKKIVAEQTRYEVARGSYVTTTTYKSNDSDYKVQFVGNYLPNATFGDWSFTYHQRTVSAGNVIVRNTNKTCRFVASKTFTASESYGKNIAIKVVKVTPKAETNTNETCILQYIQTWCYDALKSSSTELVACRPLENPYRDNTTRIGLTMVANESTDNVLDEINIITTGIARTWTGAAWTTYKEPTRNPAAWILELLTSNKHYRSQYKDSEIDLESLGAVYSYCRTNNFYCDGIITEGKKKSEVLQSILSSIFVDMVLNEEGKLEFVIDKKETNPVALLNSQNIVSITYAKTFEREITGLKTTYVDRNSWTAATEYFFKEGNHTYNQETDSVAELTLDYVTTHDHAYKVAQRQQRKAVLQPKTITANVGMEGDYYPLYSTVLLQLERFKQGIQSTTIHKTITNGGNITKLELADTIEFNAAYNYGIIIQAQNDEGKRLIYSAITATGKTNVITLDTPISTTGVVPEFNNIASIGLLNSDGTFTSVTNKMKITGVKPGDNHGWELELKDYSDDIYEYGNIPAYCSNLTRRPTTEKKQVGMRPVDYDGLRWETQGNIDRVERELSDRIDAIDTETTVCDMDLKNYTIEIDDEGYTQTVQSFSTNISLRRSETPLSFTIGDIIMPAGFSVVQDGKKLTFTVGEGVAIKAGYIQIPVQYRQVISMQPFVDENNQQFVDEDGEQFIDVQYGAEGTTWTLYFNYIGNGYSQFLGTFSQLSEIPTTTNVSNYFVWGGENRKASQLAYEGFFRQGQTYKYIGTGTGKTWSWEADDNSAHMQSALSDVLALANADLKNNNSTVWAYLDHLTANSIYCDMLVANKAFIDKLSAKIITTDLVTTQVFNSTLANYATNKALGDVEESLNGDIETLSQSLSNYVTNSKLFNNGESTIKTGVLDKASIEAIAVQEGETLIVGGFINTNVIEVEKLFVDDVSIKNILYSEDFNLKAMYNETYVRTFDDGKGLALFSKTNGDGTAVVNKLYANTITGRVDDSNGTNEVRVQANRLVIGAYSCTSRTLVPLRTTQVNKFYAYIVNIMYSVTNFWVDMSGYLLFGSERMDIYKSYFEWGAGSSGLHKMCVYTRDCDYYEIQISSNADYCYLTQKNGTDIGAGAYKFLTAYIIV